MKHLWLAATAPVLTLPLAADVAFGASSSIPAITRWSIVDSWLLIAFAIGATAGGWTYLRIVHRRGDPWRVTLLTSWLSMFPFALWFMTILYRGM